MKDNKKTINIKKKLIQIFIFVLSVGIISYLIFKGYSLLTQSANVFILENGNLTLQEETVGLLIREENVVKGQNYKNGMLQIKTEGERVAKGESIFRYYSATEESIKQKIAEVEKEIQANIPSDMQSLPSDISLLETQIKEKLDGLNKNSDLQKIQECKQDINTYMTKKINKIGESASENSVIKNLIAKRENYEKELTKNSEYINAPESGVVSYRVDGLEDVLKTDDFSYLNKKFLDGLNVKTGQIIATSEESGKIINNFKSYIAVHLNSDAAKHAQIDDNVTLQLSNSEEINAKISYINVEEDDSRVIVFEITKKIEELIQYRQISLSVIWWDYSGFKVPNMAIVTEKDKTYIMRNRVGYTEKVLVKIKRQNDDYSIIDNYTSDELKEMGYSKKEIDSMNRIAMYDEIIINPNR